MVFISKSPEVVKGEEQENQRSGRGSLPLPGRPWIYMTVKYDTRSAVPALLITRLVTA